MLVSRSIKNKMRKTCKQQKCEGDSASSSVVSDSVTPWTVACQALQFKEFSRQENLAIPFSRDHDPGIEPRSLAFQADS